MLSSKCIVLCNAFFLLFFLRTIKSQKHCSSVQCSAAGNEPDIAYPFGNKDLQGGGCGNPGFNLTCNSLDKTVLKLPQSGEFLVRKIDYANKEIRLYDQSNCVPRRLQQQNLNVNLSPFKAYAYQVYNFFNCPPSITSNPSARTIAKVPCLSDPTNTVLVTASSSSETDTNITKVLINEGCEILAPVTIPIPFNAITKIDSYDFSTDDLYLTWVEPKNSDVSKKVSGSDDPKEEGKKFDWKRLVIIMVSILAGLAGLGLTIKIIFKKCNSYNRNNIVITNHSNNHHNNNNNNNHYYYNH